jgi:DNA-binding HxlR family transcriptional regulator
MVKRRKSKVQPPPSECPLEECIKLIASAWTGNIIWYLGEGERCFTELSADLTGVSAKVLTSRLRKLERDGVLERITRCTSPPTVWYALSPLGQELRRAVVDVVDIGQRLRRAQRARPISC